MKINFLKFLPLFAALLLAIPSCKDDDEEDEQTSEVAVSSVALDKTTLEITVGETVTLKATVSPENATDKTVKWTSSDETIAKVDSKGVVTAVKEGSVKITATSEKYSTQTASCTITVKAATPSKVLVTSIALNKTATEITVGSDETLTVSKVLPEDATDKTYTWSSADEEIATVDQNGKVTAVAAGTVKITATANDGSEVKGECAVTVTAALVHPAVDDETLATNTQGTQYTGTCCKITVDEKGDSDGFVLSSDGDWKATIETLNGETIDKIEVTRGYYEINALRADKGEITINGDVATISGINSTKIILSASGAHLQVKQIKVYYKK